MKRNNSLLSRQRRVPVIAFLLLLTITCLSIEGLARFAFLFEEQLKAQFGLAEDINLDAYEMLDPDHPDNWLLKPGFSMTLNQTITDKSQSGRVLAVEYLTDQAADLQIQEEEVIFQINQDGFKGPEIDPAHTHPRILAIGDSTTFGSSIDRYSYPRVLEAELRQRGIETEVINGGVEGYDPYRVLLRLEKLKALKPEITIIYIGWNALFFEEIGFIERYLYSVRVLKKATKKFNMMFYDPQQIALAEYNRAKHPDATAPEVKRLEGFTPSFMGDVEKIALEMQASGSRIVLVTLPGLFVMDEEPSELALKIGHLPSTTDNPYVLARLSERYNIALRQLADKHGWQVVDLEQWSKTALQPRDAYFFDSVHLYEEGQAIIGVYMAEELYPRLSHD